MEKVKAGVTENINSRNYWENRFSTGDWEDKGGRHQTASFAASQVRHFRLPKGFSGLLVDFGCGTGDAFSVYHQSWPQAKLLGIDFSAVAIKLCAERYGHLADFVCGDISLVPNADIIICSNVLEHLDDDVRVVEMLLKQCQTLYVIVPYKEHPLCSEHVRSYDDNSFSDFSVTRKVIFKSRGWTEFGLRNITRIYIENIFRYLKKQSIRQKRLQILFEITSRLPSELK